jgi:methionine synthase I (cobalamin-dependent)
MECPDLVEEIHLEYIEAGADVIRTCSFRTHRRSLEKAGIGSRSRELTQLSARLARSAAEGTNVRVAGSVSPLEDCYGPEKSPADAGEEFVEIAENLIAGGCDLLIIETMGSLPEFRSAVDAAKNLGVEFWASVCPKDESTMLGGDPIAEALKVASDDGASAFLLNCATPIVLERAASAICKPSSFPIGIYANIIDESISPRDFAAHAQIAKKIGVEILGGCCGTTPEHIKAAVERLSE